MSAMPLAPTNSFFQAFAMRPEVGSIMAPLSMAEQGQVVSLVPEVQSARLIAAVTMAMAHEEEVASLTNAEPGQVQTLLRDVERGCAAFTKELEASARTLPQPLVPTASDWKLYPTIIQEGLWDYADDEQMVKIGATTVFRGPRGRHVAFDTHNELIKVGVSGKDASLQQVIMLHPGHATESYEIVFRGEGLQSLDRYLELETPTPLERALAVTNYVYFSEQYPIEHLKGPMLVWLNRPASGGPREKAYNLPRNGGERNWTIPDYYREEFSQADSHYFSIARDRIILPDSRNGDPLDPPEKIHDFSSLYVAGSKDDLTIHIARPHESNDQLMPLSPALLKLWRGAEILVLDPPDDVGYLVRALGANRYEYLEHIRAKTSDTYG